MSGRSRRHDSLSYGSPQQRTPARMQSEHARETAARTRRGDEAHATRQRSARTCTHARGLEPGAVGIPRDKTADVRTHGVMEHQPGVFGRQPGRRRAARWIRIRRKSCGHGRAARKGARPYARQFGHCPHARRRRSSAGREEIGDRDRQYGVESDASGRAAPPLFERPGGRSGDPDA